MTEHAIPIRHLCALPHPRTPLPAVTPPAAVCPGHRKHLTAQLGDITRLWLTVTCDLADTTTGTGRRVGLTTAAPTRLDVLTVTDPATRTTDDTGLVPVAGILLDWAHLIADTRRLRPARTPTTAIRLLRAHLPWLTEQPDLIADWHREARLARHTLAYLAGETRHVIAHCQALIDGVECGGPLFHHPHSSHPVQCAACGDTWSDRAVELALQQMIERHRHTDRHADA